MVGLCNENISRIAQVAILTAFASSAVAQDSEKSLELTSYLWFPKTASSVDTPLGTIACELSARDAIEDLDFGIMGTAVWRNGP